MLPVTAVVADCSTSATVTAAAKRLAGLFSLPPPGLVSLSFDSFAANLSNASPSSVPMSAPVTTDLKSWKAPLPVLDDALPILRLVVVSALIVTSFVAATVPAIVIAASTFSFVTAATPPPLPVSVVIVYALVVKPSVALACLLVAPMVTLAPVRCAAPPTVTADFTSMSL